MDIVKNIDIYSKTVRSDVAAIFNGRTDNRFINAQMDSAEKDYLVQISEPTYPKTEQIIPLNVTENLETEKNL